MIAARRPALDQAGKGEPKPIGEILPAVLARYAIPEEKLAVRRRPDAARRPRRQARPAPAA